MNITIVYDTVYKNTQKMARVISDTFMEKDVFDIRCKALDKFTEEDMGFLMGSDCILIGTPTHNWHPSRKIKEFVSFLGKNRVRNKLLAVYDTKLRLAVGGNAAKKISKHLKKLDFALLAPELELFVEDTKGPISKGQNKICRRFSEYVRDTLFKLHLEAMMDKEGFDLKGA